MKDISKLKNYRLKYKRYYEIEFDDTYDIHHIDFDRSNNDISNLILLPKKLHARYHMALNALGGVDGEGKLKIAGRIDDAFSFYELEMLKVFIEAKEEIQKYIFLKETNYGRVR